MKILDDLCIGWEQGYQASEGQLWGSNPSPVLDRFLKSANPSKNILIADYGAGDGRHALPLLKQGLNVVCIDISRTGLKKISEAANKFGLNPPFLMPASLEDLPAIDEYFNDGYCIDTLPQIAHPRRALEEIHRTLKHGAKFCVNFFTPDDAAYGEGELVGHNSFLYKNTIFNFFESKDCLKLLGGLFLIEAESLIKWQDPPHLPFRPYSHTHSALVYNLIKK